MVSMNRLTTERRAQIMGRLSLHYMLYNFAPGPPVAHRHGRVGGSMKLTHYPELPYGPGTVPGEL